MLKILVLGKSGQLGKALQSQVQNDSNFIFLNREEADLEKYETLPEILSGYKFDVLINAAAYTLVDKAEEESSRADAINAKGPGVLAEICKSKNAAMIHFSTDYVFGSGDAHPRGENHPIAPINTYGLSKWHGEEAVRLRLKEHYIIRTSWLYGLEGKNFPETMMRLANEGKNLQVVCDQIGSPTFAKDLAEVVLKIVSKSRDQHHFGTYHFSNEGVASWYDFAHAVFALGKVNPLLAPVLSSAFPTPATRPSYSVLDKSKIKDTFDLQIRHWRDALEDYMNQKYSL